MSKPPLSNINCLPLRHSCVIPWSTVTPLGQIIFYSIFNQISSVDEMSLVEDRIYSAEEVNLYIQPSSCKLYLWFDRKSHFCQHGLIQNLQKCCPEAFAQPLSWREIPPRWYETDLWYCQGKVISLVASCRSSSSPSIRLILNQDPLDAKIPSTFPSERNHLCSVLFILSSASEWRSQRVLDPNFQ